MVSSKRVTSLDVAKRAGVSRTTVSFVLNNVVGMQISQETRKRVLEAARELGYVPDAAAQALASGRSSTVGLLLARRSNVIASDMFLTQIMEVLVREVNRQGMRLLLEVIEDYERQESYLKLVRSNSLDGVIYSGPRFNDAALSFLVEHGVPTVLMGTLPDSPYCFVDIDNRAAAKRAVAHLISLGHKRVACLTNANPSYVAAFERLQGYQDALAETGQPLELELIYYGDFDPESGYHRMNNLLDVKPLPTAVFVASDVVAFGAMAAIRERGLRIPEDIALVGFDDVPVSRYIEPSLTTVQLPVMELARIATEMVVSLIRGEKLEHSQVLLDASLVVRRSCGAGKGKYPFAEKASTIEDETKPREVP
jgi:LacI family transcriptional regulator, galactose operon repressor